MRTSFVTSLFLLGLSVVSAVPVAAPDAATDAALVDSAADFSIIEARSLKVKTGRASPDKETCPKTDNGEGRKYDEHKYTKNQLKAAFLKAATLQADDKQIGENKYPHTYGNREKLEFDCGNDKMEFPIQLDGKTYDGGATDKTPDRVIYEYSKDESKNELIVKFCGVIRHGPGADFLNCKS